MLRILSIPQNELPRCFNVVETNGIEEGNFEPGQIAQFYHTIEGIACGVSDGSGAIGIIDDIRTPYFTDLSIDEEMIVPVNSITTPNGYLVTPVDVKTELKHSNIEPESF